MFETLVSQLKDHFSKMCETGHLFTVDLSDCNIGYKLSDTYLENFREGDDPVFRDPDSSTHNCNNDKNFIRRYGNIVTIIDGKLVTMWDLELDESNIYYSPFKAMSSLIKSGTISGPFLEDFSFLNVSNFEKTNKNAQSFRLGVDKSFKKYTKEEVDKFGVVNTEDVYLFHHFHVDLPRAFVNFTNRSKESIIGELRDNRNLLEKGLRIPLETLELVRDLIQQGSLLRGDIYLAKVLDFIESKKEFENVDKTYWSWLNCNHYLSRFSNELIGTFCIELAEGKEINKACKDFNFRIDPTNYNKAKAPITKAMFELAEKQITDLGYLDSFERRFASIEDIDVSEIKHSNVDNAVEKPVGLFAKAGVPSKEFSRHKRSEFDKIEEVSIDKFMSTILPNATSLEVFLENKMENNLVALFTEQKQSKNLFKWNNPFSWTYNGNLSGKSMIKENVKTAGGNVTGVLRCSLQWNDEDTKGIVDYDLHCKTPFTTIYYSNKKDAKSGGWLDVDMIRPRSIGVENITWQKVPLDGNYDFIVDTFCSGSNTGFKVEIEFNGQVFNYHYNKTTAYKSKTNVATVFVKKGEMTIKHHLPETNQSRKIWNLETNQFHKVNLVCTSPNHWGDNNIGTKEYFFMLQDCKTDIPMRAFHVDQLNGELMSVRKAIDILGNYKQVEPTDKQLCGVGFNGTVKEELIVKVKGSHQRVLKIKI